MADEITISAAVRLLRSNADIGLSQIARQFDQAGTKYCRHRQTIGVAEEALVKGEVATPGYIIAVNLDPTNFVSIRPGTGLANTVRLDANFGPAVFRFGSGATNPFAIADTAPCEIDYLLLEA